MIGLLKGGAIGLGFGLLLSIGAYFNGRSDGKAVIQAVLDEQRATWQESYDKQAADTAAKEAAWAAQNKELDNAWKDKLGTAESAVDGLSARLRRATGRGRCPVPGDPAPAGAPTESGVSSGVSEIERDADEAWRTCAGDSAKLIEVVTRYNNLRE